MPWNFKFDDILYSKRWFNVLRLYLCDCTKLVEQNAFLRAVKPHQQPSVVSLSKNCFLHYLGLFSLDQFRQWFFLIQSFRTVRTKINLYGLGLKISKLTDHHSNYIVHNMQCILNSRKFLMHEWVEKELLGHFVFFSMQDYSLGIFLRQTWNDSRLSYKKIPSLRSLELDSRLIDNIWVPDLFITNEKKAIFHTVTVPNKLMHIYPEGRVQYSVRYDPHCINLLNMF